MIVQVFLDGGDQLRHVFEDAASNAFVCDFAEPALHHVDPGTGRWDEVQMESRISFQPGFDTRMLVGRVVVGDDVQIQSRRSLDIDLFEEANELLVPMARHAFADHLAIQHAQGREQGRRAVALVVMRHRAAAPLFDRQPRLGAVEGLDLAFLVDAQDNGSFRRIKIKPDNIVELIDEMFVAAEFESLDQVRLEVMLLPYSVNRGLADTLGLRHRSSAPVSCRDRLCVQSGLNDSSDFALSNGRDAAGTWSIFLESGHAQSKESLSPQLHRWSRDFQPACDVLAGHTVSSHGDDLSALNNPQGLALRTGPGGQSGTFLWRQHDRWSEVHDAYDSSVETDCKVIYESLH